MANLKEFMISAGILVVVAAPADGTTLRVPSQYPTIQRALNAAVGGDTVEVACGTYSHGDISMKSGVVLCSETGDPECVILDAAVWGRFLCVGVDETTVIEGLTFTGARNFSAMECLDGAALTVRNCVFRDNRSYAGDFAGGVKCQYSTAVFEHCWFEDNHAWTGPAGAMSTESSHVTVRYCTFLHNGHPCAYAVGSGIRIENGTFADSPGASFVQLNLADAVIDNCVFAFGAVAVDCYFAGSEANLTCCDIFGNAGGDWIGCIADQYGIRGNISEDPQFCDLATRDLTLHFTSPCAPFTAPNPECDLIGAWAVGCGETAVQLCTWGKVKGLFRQ